jgi:parvulin-like peptidyl-prolyl isomerase
MAIIGKIREKSWLILVLVGGALLAFILGDWQKISGGNEDVYGFGTVYGEKVDIDRYNEMFNIADANAERTAQQQQQPKKPVDETAVWNSFVQEIVLNKEYNALGLEISQSEFDAYLYGTDGFSVMPDLAQSFIDSTTGLFNSKLLQARIDEMKSSDDPEIQKQWAESEQYYIDKRKREKYFEILQQGIFVTDLEAKEEYVAQKEVKNVSYIMKRYSEIEIDEIDVSDEKLKAFFEEHKSERKYHNRYANRDVKFIDIAVEPSAKDSNEFNNQLEDLKTKFASATDDSVFVMDNSEKKFYVKQIGYRVEGAADAKQGFTYPKFLDTVFKTAVTGDVVGPYQQEGMMNIAKVIDVQDKLLTVRHLLIGAQRADTDAVAKAQKTTDSLMAIINKDNFEELVKKHSQDPGSNQTGGKYENFVDGEMVPEFSEYSLNEPIGKIGYVQTDFGFHIMEVLERKDGHVPNLAIVSKTLKASQQTIDEQDEAVYKLLYELDEKLTAIEDPLKKVEMFDSIVKREGHFARPANIQDDSPKLYGFTSKFAEDKILELAFDEEAQVGDLVNSPIRDGNKYIIAVLAAIKEKGEPNFEDVKPMVKNEYIREEKAKRFIAQMRKAKKLDELTMNGKGTMQKAELTFSNPQITGAGYEPEVVGAVFSGLKDGQMTKPLKGKQGVYVIRIDKTLKAPATENYDAEKGQLLSAGKAKVQGDATKALVDKAEVVDNRRFYNLGIRR